MSRVHPSPVGDSIIIESSKLISGTTVTLPSNLIPAGATNTIPMWNVTTEPEPEPTDMLTLRSENAHLRSEVERLRRRLRKMRAKLVREKAGK